MLNIEDFICNFRNRQSHIENGSKCVCNLFGTDYHYYFAKILQAAYPGGQVCLALPEKHFVYKYAEQTWDIEGRYTDGVKLINETKIPNDVLRVFKHLNSSPNTYDKDIDAWIEQAKTE